MCSGRSIRFVHVLQPTLHDTGSKPLTEDELKSSMLSQEWMDAVKAGYPRLREVGAELARSGIAFHDESMLFEHVEQSLYYDGIHFAVAGHQMFARAIADAILEQLEREPVAPQEPRPRARGKKKKQGAK
jgi:lysophospholipase L1-like esterase